MRELAQEHVELHMNVYCVEIVVHCDVIVGVHALGVVFVAFAMCPYDMLVVAHLSVAMVVVHVAG